MKINTPTRLLMAASWMCLAGLILAQNPATVPTAPTAKTAPQISDAEKWLQGIKKPDYWLSWGGDLRLRPEYYENAASLDPLAAGHDQFYLRMRARVYGTIAPFEPVSFNFRLTTEPRYYFKKTSPNYVFFPNKTGWEWQEAIFDVFNLKITNLFNGAASLTVGRQDMIFGDGWLVMDGTPLDGSRTFFFDAARLTYQLPESHLTFDLVYIDQAALNDRWLPPINHIQKAVIDQNERGAIAYVTYKPQPTTLLEGYFMYKHDQRSYSHYDNRLTAKGDNGDIYTFGAHYTGDHWEHLRFHLEGAYQFGRKQDPGQPLGGPPSATLYGDGYRDISAFGLNSRLSYLVKDKANNQFHLSYEYLSGDDPGTATDEMFDSLWARWPMWSELYIYSYQQETRMAQTANLHKVGPGWTVAPCKFFDFTAHYFLLYADQSTPTRATITNPNFTRNGSHRGQYLQTIIKWKYNQHVSGHLWGEWVWPGDFYKFNEMFTFLRADLTFTL